MKYNLAPVIKADGNSIIAASPVLNFVPYIQYSTAARVNQTGKKANILIQNIPLPITFLETFGATITAGVTRYMYPFVSGLYVVPDLFRFHTYGNWTVSDLFLGASFGAGTFTLTVRKNGQDTALTISQTFTTGWGYATNATDTFTITTGDYISFKGVGGTGQAAQFTARVKLTAIES